MNERLETWRCWDCGRILERYRFSLAPGTHLVRQIKCHCNAWNIQTIVVPLMRAGNTSATINFATSCTSS